jgi:hypothetical protein
MPANIDAAIHTVLKQIDEETKSEKMTQQEARDFYDALLDELERRYGILCDALDGIEKNGS